MRILLTGATGFFGRALLRHLASCADPPDVIGLSRRPDRFLEAHPDLARLPWLNLVAADVMEPSSLRALPAFDAVLHAATDSTIGPSIPALAFHDQIVSGTRNMLDLAVERGVKRVLLTSSGGVYGRLPADGGGVSEDFAGAPDPLDPRNAYACGKRAAEHLCALYQASHGLEPVIARCFAFVGQDLPLDAHFAVGNFMRDALRADTIDVAGDGRSVRSYLDQRDLAHWLMVLLREGRAGRAYNVGAGEPITIRDLAQLVAQVLAPGKRVNVLGAASAAATRYVPDVTRARTELGLFASIPLAQAILDAGQARHHSRS